MIERRPYQMTNKILCYYMNLTNFLQIARMNTIHSGKFERIIFPRDRLMFEAFPDNILEIETANYETVTISIPCNKLRVREEINSDRQSAAIHSLNDCKTSVSNLSKKSNFTPSLLTPVESD